MRGSRRARPRHDEANLQQAFVSWLRIQNICFFSVPNESPRFGSDAQFFGWQKRLRKTGKRAGAPDIVVVLKCGKTVFMEFKKDSKSKLSKSQRIFHEECPKKIHVVCSLQDAINIIKDDTSNESRTEN